jgi:hypothetical protein
MHYGATTKATDFRPDDWKTKAARVLFGFIPRASPDNERLYPHVKKWLVEIDDNGTPQREIGLGDGGIPLFAAPDKRNCGFWTDSPYTFTTNELEPVSAEEFEVNWLFVGGANNDA